MRLYFYFALVLFPCFASAGVYKWVGPDGQIHYSDRPMTGSERVSVPVQRTEPDSNREATNEESGAVLGPYGAFEILSPEPNQTLRQAEATLELSLLIDPPLAPGHRVQVVLDGQPVPGDIEQTQILMRDLAYGSHRVQVRIRDDLDITIASSPPVDFHLRKPVP